MVVVGALAAVSLAGCDANTPTNANPDVPTIEPATSTGSTTPTSVAPPANTQPSPTTVAVPAPPPSTAAGSTGSTSLPGCRSADLRLSVGRGDAAAGTVYRPLVFINIGTGPCAMHGFPGVSYVAGDDGHQVGPAAERVGEKGDPVTLAPREMAYADIGFVNVRDYDEAACRPTPVRGLRVYPPHETVSIFVPLDGTGCAGNPPGQQLTTKALRAGPG